MLTKFHNSKFEFIFTNYVQDSPRLFATIQTVFRAYDTSRMYRDLKLRGAVISDKELKLLPSEQVYSQVDSVHSVHNLDTVSKAAPSSALTHGQWTLLFCSSQYCIYKHHTITSRVWLAVYSVKLVLQTVALSA